MADVLLFEGICSSRSHRGEWKNGPDDSSLYRDIVYAIDIT
jgi:hypothetical protein